MVNFDLSQQERRRLLDSVITVIENYYSNVNRLRVTPLLDPEQIRRAVRSADFSRPSAAIDAVNSVTESLEKFIVHLGHPMYYGLFNPRPNFPSVVADLISAVYNPQLAAWSHSPYASEVENYLISEFGRKLGFPDEQTDGVFATGGAEANITAVLCALNHRFPETANSGLFNLSGRPVIYCSSEAHHSIIRAARTSGLGKESVRMIAVNERLEIIPGELEKTVTADLSAGAIPFMLVGTAGTTGSGSIDDLNALALIANHYNLWYHVDSAWGGAAILNPASKGWIGGIEKADSVTLDVHKWLSVPMSASMFITRNREILPRTFRITTEYMPKDAEQLEIADPYSKSIQWSRRFIGLKLYFSLMVFGWDGYSEIIGHQIETGNLLRRELAGNGWQILNYTPLPLVCFTDGNVINDPGFTKEICDKVVKSGKAWISVYPVNGTGTLRACITNYNTTEKDIKELVNLVGRFRSEYSGAGMAT
jgi:glutamate/tyrosine decarboxylase-like PLP-dependent enzyme